MKKKLSMLIAVVAIVMLLACVFAFTAAAEDETIAVTYNWIGGYQYGEATPNEDGSYTLRTNKQSGDATSTLGDGTVVNREFYGWFDEAGNLYAPGATVTFTKSTMLYEAYGITVYNAQDFMNNSGHCYVKLGADITLTETISMEWRAHMTNLNGYTLTSTARSVASIKRGSFIVHGPGKIVHEPTTLMTGKDESAVYIWSHGYGDDDAPQQFWIGKGVELTTPYSAFRCGGVSRVKHPRIAIAGTVNSRALARINAVPTDAICNIYDTAKIATSESFIEFTNQTGVNNYMNMTIDGIINVANGEGVILTDFVLQKVNVNVNGGKLCVAESDKEKISFYLSDAVMIQEKTEDDLTWMEIVPSDCEHSWIKNMEQSIDPTMTSLGKDVFTCELCQREKSVITVYDPTDTEVTITIKDAEGKVTDLTVKAGDVMMFGTTGVGENTSFALIGIKGTDEIAEESVISVEIPVGVGVINVTAANSTLEEINIKDGVRLEITSLAGLTGIKTINVGAATVAVTSIGNNTSLEAFNSSVAGANITFKNTCFDGKSNLKYFTMSNGSTYTFGENSFRKTGIEEVVFPDEVTVEFKGNAAFYEAAVKYVYFGKSITNIYNKPFDCANNLETVVIMAATNITDYCFCVADAKNSKSVVKVYCHSADIKFTNNTFINRNSQGIEFYTIDPDITSVGGCKYVVYNGIPHAYAEGIVKEPTCISTGIAGSTTDCVCGINEVVTYTVYTAEGSYEETTEQRELPISNIHVLGTDLVNINYKEGVLALGTKEYYCALCKTATVEEETPSAKAIFESYGYSICTYSDTPTMTQGFRVDYEAYEAYKQVLPNFTFGIVAAGNKTGDAVQPLKVENGAVKANNKAVVGNVNVINICYFEIKISGISESNKEANMVFCAYIFDGTDVKYIEDGEIKDSVAGTSYVSLIAE